MTCSFMPLAKMAIVTVLITIAGCGSAQTFNKQLSGPVKEKTGSVIKEEEFGIRVERVNLSAGGYMIDFRYRVVNKKKASPLFKTGLDTYLIEQNSGKKFAVPVTKTGPVKSVGNPVENRVYFSFFANPGRYVKKGNKVTVVIGNMRLENLVVE